MKIEDNIIQLTKDAGKAIIDVYNDISLNQQIEKKGDNSPLTLADKRSHEVIEDRLRTLYPQIPIISEEGAGIDYKLRKNYERFWLVDPLDGTKEFINKNGEFTVNIALIENGYPTCGYIYVPVQDVVYAGSIDGAIKIHNGVEEKIHVSGKSDDRTAVRSRSHATPEEDAILKHYQVTKEISKGSSLKFCAVAEGSADLYYRAGPTMEWDTAAGQAILEAAGGRVFIGNSEEKRFVYNKENLLNPGFLCLGF